MTLLEERVSRVNGKPNLCRLVVEVRLVAVRPYELLLAAQAIVDGASVVGKHAVVTVHEQRRNIHVRRGGDAVEEQPLVRSTASYAARRRVAMPSKPP